MATQIKKKKTTSTPSGVRSPDGIERIASAIKGIETAMLTTVDQSGHMHSRPMQTMQVEFDGNLWFFTREDSPKVSELDHDGRVNISYADNAKHLYVSISGRVELVKDKSKVKELWSPIQRAWFPKGIDDPALVLIKVKAEQAEIWEAPAGKAIELVQLVRSLLSGRFREPPGRSQKFDLAA